MFRGLLTVATAVSTARADCAGCAFTLTALEEFSVDFELVTYFESFNNPRFSQSTPDDRNDGYGNRYHREEATGVNFETTPLPASVPSDHGTLAIHARNLQLKIDNNARFPADFTYGDGYRRRYGPPPVNLPLGGFEFHEELHINGATRQASYHFASQVFNACFQVDLPSSIPIPHNVIDARLHQAEQVAPIIMQQHGTHAKVNGQDVMGFVGNNPAYRYGRNGPSFLFTNASAPALITLPMPSYAAEHYQSAMQPSPDGYVLGHLAMKFDNYANTVGSAFAARACEIESHHASQSLLASSPETRDFLVNRVADHQKRLQALLEPELLNTQFNFIPLQIADAMFPEEPPCTAEELAQTPAIASNFQAAFLAAGSFAMGAALTIGMFRKKPQSSAEDYHQVSA